MPTLIFPKTPKLAGLLLAFAALESSAIAETVTTVTTYVVKKQEERKSTRFTLTEWLRIKERMKLMDLWLAIYSGGDKPKFSPELQLSYGMYRGDQTSLKIQKPSSTDTTEVGMQSESSLVSAQLWLTNLVSSQLGFRFFNVDLGLEGSYRRGDGTMDWTDGVSLQSGLDLKTSRVAWTGVLRIFGRNIQDSSLILRGGRYRSSDLQTALVDSQASNTKYGFDHSGPVYGIGLQLYFINWLGIEGNAFRYLGRTDDSRRQEINGTEYDYAAFIEISLLRFLFGRYQAGWTSDDNQDLDFQRSGFFGAVRLQI